MSEENQMQIGDMTLPKSYLGKLKGIANFGLQMTPKASMESLLTYLDVADDVKSELLERAYTYEGDYVVFEPLGDWEDYVIVGHDPLELVDEAIRHFDITVPEPVESKPGM